MLPLARPVLWRAGAWTLALGIAAGSLIPGPLVAAAGTLDKLEHALAYLLLTLWLVGITERRQHARAALGVWLFGAALELAQLTLTVSRVADWADAAANTAGIVLAVLLARHGAAGWALRAEAWLGWRRPG